ncbi:MAG TPA: hypothetical protein VGJ48_16520 [Pyrinomonadaceae bacterium]|jgi:hypothetical protein
MSQDKAHTSLSSPELTVKEDLHRWIARTKTRLLCNAVLNTEIRVLHWVLSKVRLDILKVENTLASTTIATIVLVGILYALTILVGKLWDDSVSIWNLAALFVSFLTAFSLSLVKRLHDTILSSDKNNIARLLIQSAPEDDNSLRDMRDWWKSFLSLRLQIPFVLVIGLLAVWMLHKLHPHIQIHLGSYFLILIFGMAVGQGGYCALLIPRLATVIRKIPMRMFWLYPADTPWVKKISSVFTKLSIANAFIGTCIMFGMLWLKPWESFSAAGIAGAVLVGTWAIVLYSFIYPHFQLGKILKAEQMEQMGQLQKIIDSKSLMPEHPSEDEIKKLNEMIKVYEQVASARASAIDTQAVLRLLFSLGIPMLSFLAVLIDLGRRLSDFVKGTGLPH